MTLRLFSSRSVTVTVVLAACLSLTGCASTYTVNSLPRQYAARPTLDFSTLDLTAWAQPAPNESLIRTGDRLQLTLDTGAGGADASKTWNVGVDDDGSTTLPNIGRLHLAGLSQSQAEQTVVNESITRQVYLTPAVDIKLEKRFTNSIFVAGAVRAPGSLTFAEPALTLADVIVRSGGLTNSATGQVTINQAASSWDGGDQLTTVSQSSSPESPGGSVEVDLSSTSAEELASIRIPAGSTISFGTTTSRSIRVIGVIGDRELPIPPGRDVRLLDALALAGGPRYSDWILSRVDVIRRVPGKNETVRIRTSIRKAKKEDKHNLLLAPDDILSVEENPITFTLSTLGGLTGLTNVARTTIP